jgi:uncharacterized membrane protein
MGKMLFFLCASLLLCSCAQRHAYPEAPFDGKEVRISLDGLDEGKPVFHTFYADGKKINYFVVKAGKSVSSYFDACAKCNPMKLGYKPDGDYVICRACNVRYSVEDLKEGIGSCYPIKLAGRVEGRSYVIDRKVLQAGEKYF